MSHGPERSPYRLGFTSLDREAATDALPLRGQLPAWLRGTLLRTAPSRFEVDGRSYNHWFDGLAMLHRFAFGDGRVSYASRFLRGAAFRAAEQTGRIGHREFATDPCRTLFGRVAALFFPSGLTDNCNVSVNALAGQVVALTETPLPVRFDPETLETLGVFDYDGRLAGQTSTAHPHYDFERGRHYSYVLEFGRRSVYRLFSVAADTGRQALVAELPVDRPAYMHSFGMTERYLILTEFPLVVNPLRLRLSGKPFIRNYRWRPDRGVRFHVVDKRDGRVAKVARGDALFAFHHVNAFEEGDAVVVDMVAYPDSRVIDQLYLARFRSAEPVDATGLLTRFRVPTHGGGERVSRETLSEAPLELPRIDYARRVGRPYRFVYGTGNRVRGDFLDSLVKIDVETGEVATWHEAGCYPGEPVFVAAPDASAEDDGVILSVVLDARRGASFLLVMEAGAFVERARAEVPHHVPFGFHGNYFPAAPDGAASLRDIHR